MEVNAILKTDEAKLNFLKGLIRIAKCDGVIDEQEFVFYAHTASVLGLNQESIGLLDQYRKESDRITIQFKESREKMFFFVQAVQLCWVNDEYSEQERAEVKKLAEELGVSQGALEQIEAWVYEGMMWNKKGDELLELQ